MAQLEFDEKVGKRLEAMYRTRDVLRRRRLVREALAAQPGERVLDVGTGPGFYAAELLDLVGPEGSVTGVDSSAAMLAIAADRCQAHSNVTFAEGDVVDLPVDDGYFDAALSVQVLEYVEDVAGALSDIHRSLRPGGRVVLWDVDWTTLSLNATDSDLSARVLAGWDEHLAHPALPRTLASQMRSAGFGDVDMEGHAFATTALDPETYGGSLVRVIESYLVEQEILDAQVAAAWGADQRELDERGEFFCAVTQFCFSGRA
jgi:SAM-dependent methyltransferase